MDRHQAVLLRADLMQMAKGLELQRSAILSIVSRIEKQYEIEPEKGNGNGKSKDTTSGHPHESRTYPKKATQGGLSS